MAPDLRTASPVFLFTPTTMQDYATQALRFESPGFSHEDRLIHGVLGLTTEIDELKTATSHVNRLEEIGDLCWFFALVNDALIRLIHLPPVSKSQIEDSVAKGMRIETAIATIADAAKRLKFYKSSKKINTETLAICVARVGEYISMSAMSAAAMPPADALAYVQRLNIAKLTKRYGVDAQFTTDAAVNRNVAAEQAILEGGAQ